MNRSRGCLGGEQCCVGCVLNEHEALSPTVHLQLRRYTNGCTRVLTLLETGSGKGKRTDKVRRTSEREKETMSSTTTTRTASTTTTKKKNKEEKSGAGGGRGGGG